MLAEDVFDKLATEYPHAKAREGVSWRQAVWEAYINDPRHKTLRAQLLKLKAPNEKKYAPVTLFMDAWAQLCDSIHDPRFMDWSHDGVSVLLSPGSAVTMLSCRVMKLVLEYRGYLVDTQVLDRRAKK